MDIKIHRGDRSILLYNPQLAKRPDRSLFDFAELPVESSGSTARLATGRGQVLYRQFDGLSVVVRHYRRGGMISKLSTDSYWYSGLQKTRMWREFALLLKLYLDGLPVPMPVAAQIERRSLVWYRGDLATQKIDGAVTLVESISSAPLADAQWQAVGQVLRRFHDKGCYHADLNAGNIMLDHHGAVYLIDLDRGCLLNAGNVTRFASNLRRLKRSLDTFAEKRRGLHFSPSDWEALLTGYGEVR
ncbi:hypothetical protein AB833_14130 [Chromatiales bacterium (ex Bugula neritina AB1)]|nr:hypothetical protein AB833_14130 [Chromatiales bacterium (ex Bugula neritina AB1)]